MSDKLLLNGRCPRCNHDNNLLILHINNESDGCSYKVFRNDEWKYFCFNSFSVALYCSKCKNYASADIAIDNEKITPHSKLSDFADKNGVLSENKDVIIDIDTPALLPPQHTDSPSTTCVSDLFKQAEQCYKIKAWDAVGIVCRKIIDIEMQKLWRQLYPYDVNKTEKQNKIPALANMLEAIFAPEIRNLKGDKSGIKRSEIINLINGNDIKHKIFYVADNLREIGNEAAHSILAFSQDEAEHALISAEYSMDLINEIKKLNHKNT
ncbi:TPA: hypothetical protein ACKRTC_000613 [Proteus mirabilis]